MTMLTIVQETCRLLRIPVPSDVASSTDDSTLQLLALLNRSGRALARRHTWSKLITIQSFSGANASQVQTGYPTSDHDRFVPVARIWDDNLNKFLSGPHDYDTWTRLTTDTLGTHDRVWTMIAGVINMLPVTATTDTFKYAYVTKNWVDPASGADDDEFDTNTDDHHFPHDDLLILDLVWRWKQAKGLDYAEDMATAEMEIEKAIARDRGPKIIYTARAFRNDDVLENSWPGTLGS